MEIWSAFIIGLLGSLHCAGMCGPIAMALPLTTKEKFQVFLQSFLYNIGRISTYALMGLFMGLLGWGIALTGYQKVLSIGLGALLILSALFSVSIEQKLMGSSFFQNIFNNIKNRLSKSFAIRSTSGAFRIGMLNGILPCGLVYIALAGAVASGNHISGAIYMAAFGLGTLPMMLGLMVIGNFQRKFFVRFRRFIPVGLVLFGILLIYRGLMLDIPADLSFWEANNFPTMCH